MRLALTPVAAAFLVACGARLQVEKDRAEAERARRAAELAKQSERGLVLTLGDVLFESGRAELNNGAFRTVDRLVAFMREHPERSLEVEGYTDSVGGDALNLALSQRRANTVHAALVSHGVKGSRISAKGMGKASPVASNETAEGRQRNRRVEARISGTT